MILTDPPWNVGSKVYGSRKDSMSMEDYAIWLEQILYQCYRVLKQSRSLLIESSHKNLPLILDIGREFFIYQQPIVLYCTNGIGRRSLVGWNCCSIVIWFTKGKAKVFKHFKDLISWSISNKAQEWSHPSPKSVSAYTTLIKMFSKETEVILDPFIGSGTTMLACQESGRSCIGIEINPEYCEIVKKRCFGRQFLDREVEYYFTREGEKIDGLHY